MKSRLLFSFLILLGSCQNIEDASPVDLKSFVHLYEGPLGITAVEIENLPDGFAILGNMTVSSDSTVTMLFNTDEKGNVRWQKTYYNFQSKALSIVRDTDGSTSGYIIAGDRIKIAAGAEPVANQEIYLLEVLRLNESGEIDKELVQSGDTIDNVIIDLKCSALLYLNNSSADQDTVLLMGSYQAGLSDPEKTFLIALDQDFNTLWKYEFESLERSDLSGKSIYHKNNFTYWISSLYRSTGEFSDSYLGFSKAAEQQDRSNYSNFNQTTQQLMIAEDMTAAKDPTFGFAAIGTYSSTSSENSNMFFIRANNNGTFISGSDVYLDGSAGVTTNDASEVDDTGDAIAATRDRGFILAGSSLSTPRFGNGERDIFLVKVNASGEVMWTKHFGGSGDEVVNSVIETADGYIAVCGTNTIGGFSSIFLIKTNENGELTN